MKKHITHEMKLMTMKKSTRDTIMWFFATIWILFATIMLAVVGSYVYYKWFYQVWSPARIERVTGVRVPKYKIIESHKGPRGFNGDYNDWHKIEFKTIPSDELFDEIDKKIETGKTAWSREGKSYSFSVMWGNGFPTPKGERDDDDGMFSITMKRGEKTGRIFSGTW